MWQIFKEFLLFLRQEKKWWLLPLILALQTIASREVKPTEMVVVTVGYIQAGTKNNIIPDQAELGLTVRTRNTEVRKQVLAAITRITKAEAEAADAPRTPSIDHYESADLVCSG